MAVTKIKSIKTTLKKAIDYITDEAKTDDALLVSSFGCEPKSAHLEFQMTDEFAKVMKDKDYSKQSKNLAYHTIQSFSKDDDITPEQAHEIGKQLANQLTKEKYQYVISTHIDKGHVHNHIIFNATSFETFRKFDCNKHVFKEIRAISDQLCKENGLSVIDATKSKSKGVEHKEWSENKKGTSWKSKLKVEIDNCIKRVNSFEDFIAAMKAAGYEVKEGQHISFRATGEGQQRFTRAKTLGVDYTEEMIKSRISSVDKVRLQAIPKEKAERTVHRRSSKTIPFTVDKQVVYYSRKQQLKDVKELANMLMTIRQENIMRKSDFNAKIEQLRNHSSEIKGDIKSLNAKVQSYTEVAKYIHTVERTKPIYEKYQKSLMKKVFRTKNEGDILSHEFAVGKLQELKIDPSVTSEKVVSLAKQFTQETAALNKNLKDVDRKIRDLKKVQSRVLEIVGKEMEEKKKQRTIENERF